MPASVSRRVSNLARCRHMVPLHRNLGRAVRNRFHLARPGEEVEYRLADGTVLAVDSGPSDVIAINEIWGEACYEPDERFRVRPGWRVLDLGAHKGTFAVRAARRGAARVLAVEPEPRNVALLRRNVERNAPGVVEVLEGAVAGSAGTGVLRTSDSPTGHVLAPGGDVGAGAVEVRLVTLPELVAQVGGRVDLLKVDVEGGEFEAFEATPADVWAQVDRVSMEYHGAPDGGSKDDGARRLRRLLESVGFRVSVDDRHWLLHAHREAP